MTQAVITILILCAVSYLIGSLPFGFWIARLWKGVDIRTLGSKNTGATNVMRVLGPGPGLLVLALDTLKGAAGILLAGMLVPDEPFAWRVLIGLFAVVGHTFSPFLRFKGGKGVATSLGVLLALSWPVGVTAVVVWLLCVGIWRYVSLASIAAALSLPLASWVFMSGVPRAWMLGLTVALALLVIWRHRANIERLLAGTEAKLGQRVEAPTDAPDTSEE